MEGYGNILTLINTNEEQIKDVENILNGHPVAYQRLENVFFLLIPPIAAPERFARIADDLKEAKVKFVFYFVAISDRSLLRTKGLPAEASAKIREYLINNN